MREGGYYFWLGASADADPATHEPSQSALSRPSGECPLREEDERVWYGLGSIEQAWMRGDFGYLPGPGE